MTNTVRHQRRKADIALHVSDHNAPAALRTRLAQRGHQTEQGNCGRPETPPNADRYPLASGLKVTGWLATTVSGAARAVVCGTARRVRTLCPLEVGGVNEGMDSTGASPPDPLHQISATGVGRCLAGIVGWRLRLRSCAHGLSGRRVGRRSAPCGSGCRDGPHRADPRNQPHHARQAAPHRFYSVSRLISLRGWQRDQVCRKSVGGAGAPLRSASRWSGCQS